MQKLTTHVSVVGEAVYPHLNKPDVKFNEAGEYKVTLKVAKSDATNMIKLFNNAQADSLKKAIADNKGKKVKEAPHPRYNVEGNNVFFIFKLKASGVNKKTKESFTQRPQILDADKKPFPMTKQIWGGSKLKVAYELVPYYAPFGAGITARMKAIQVLELVEGKSDIPFEKEDGYKAEINSDAQTEVQKSSDF